MDKDIDRPHSGELSFLDFINCLLDAMFENTWSDEKHIDPKYVDVISIPVPNVSFIDFNLSSEMKTMMHSQGYNKLRRDMCNLDIL